MFVQEGDKMQKQDVAKSVNKGRIITGRRIGMYWYLIFEDVVKLPRINI